MSEGMRSLKCKCYTTQTSHDLQIYLYRGDDKSLARPGRKQATAKEGFDVHISYIIGRILVLYITRLASNEIFSLSNKIHREVGRAKDLSAHRYIYRTKKCFERKL
jgi:hypothetical protein